MKNTIHFTFAIWKGSLIFIHRSQRSIKKTTNTLKTQDSSSVIPMQFHEKQNLQNNKSMISCLKNNIIL